MAMSVRKSIPVHVRKERAKPLQEIYLIQSGKSGGKKKVIYVRIVEKSDN